jgi:hypothetical protein
MPTHRGYLPLLALSIIALLVLTDVAHPRAGAAAAARRIVRGTTAPTTVVIVGSARGRPIPPGFLGVSLEYNTVAAYEGSGPTGPNPVLAQLIRNLAPGQTPIIRIGGDSTDWSWWPAPRLRRPRGVRITLSSDWLDRAQELLSTTGAKLILGIDLEAGSPALEAVEARNLLAGIGGQNLVAMELGNEPQLYAGIPWYRTAAGVRRFGRASRYDLADYGDEFRRFSRALPGVPLAGPSIGRSWLSQLAPFIVGAHGPRVVTYHAYAINHLGDAFRGRNCATPAGTAAHPTVGGLLAPIASIGLTRGLAPYISLSHRRGLAFRIDELNAITCAGMPGVSDTFASALWALETVFAMARAGADGVNVHTWGGSVGKLFAFNYRDGAWWGSVRPEYYGLLMFAQAASPGSRFLRTAVLDSGAVQAWALRAPDGSTRVVVVNNSLRAWRSALVLPIAAAGQATLERLSAPGARATGGVTLACQSFGTETSTGVLEGAPCTTTTDPPSGEHAVRMPPASAALLTIPGYQGESRTT